MDYKETAASLMAKRTKKDIWSSQPDRLANAMIPF